MFRKSGSVDEHKKQQIKKNERENNWSYFDVMVQRKPTSLNEIYPFKNIIVQQVFKMTLETTSLDKGQRFLFLRML